MASAPVGTPAQAIGQPPAGQQPPEPEGGGHDHHDGGGRAREAEHVLGVDEGEAVRRARDDRHRERQRGDHHQPAPERALHGPEHGHRVLARRFGDGEAIGLDHPAPGQREQGQRDDGQAEDAPEPQAALGQPVEDRRQAGPDPVSPGDEGDRLGPVRRRRVLGRPDLAEGRGRR